MGGPLAGLAAKSKRRARIFGLGQNGRPRQFGDKATPFVAKQLRTKREHGTKRPWKPSLINKGFAYESRKDKIMVQVAAALLFALAAGIGVMVIVAMRGKRLRAAAPKESHFRYS